MTIFCAGDDVSLRNVRFPGSLGQTSREDYHCMRAVPAQFSDSVEGLAVTAACYSAGIYYSSVSLRRGIGNSKSHFSELTFQSVSFILVDLTTKC